MERHTVNTQTLETTAAMMVADGKGLLAIDESTGTCNKRFAKWQIPQTAEAHRQYRDLIVNTPGLNESISGAILYDETIRQKKDDGTPFAKALAAVGIITGGPRRCRPSRARRLQKVWMACALGWRSMRRWAHALQSGERSRYRQWHSELRVH
jgi:hypothetical protein